MRNVLLVSRRTDVQLLAPGLESGGFSVSVLRPDEFAERADEERPSVLVVDARDFPPSAIELVVNSWRETTVTVVLCEERALEHLPLTLELDDFAVLPVGAVELRQRIERALWRRFGVDEQDVIRCGALAIDLANYRVTVGGEPVVLTFKEYELLRFLAMNAGRVFTREQLLNRVWGYDYFGGARTVDVHIRRIRAKIEIKGHRFIETVRNVGYRLVPSAGREPLGQE